MTRNQPSDPKAKAVARAVMVEAAQRCETLAYSELANAINRECGIQSPYRGHDSRLFNLLGEISTEENAAGRGMLTAIVVRLGEGWPGDGFFNLARRLGRNVPKDVHGMAEFWCAEVRRVFEAHGKGSPS